MYYFLIKDLHKQSTYTDKAEIKETKFVNISDLNTQNCNKIHLSLIKERFKT